MYNCDCKESTSLMDMIVIILLILTYAQTDGFQIYLLCLHTRAYNGADIY